VKTDTHPNYRTVVFQDTSSDLAFLTKSTIETSDTIDWEDGNTYPLAKVEISSASHPFYTGKQILVDTTGRVERFRKRYGKTSVKKAAPEAAAEAVEEAVVEAEIEAVEEAIVEAEVEIVEEAIVEAEVEAVEEAVVVAELEAEAEVVLEAEAITEADSES
jgi:large subunit ribosomal protein L31